MYSFQLFISQGTPSSMRAQRNLEAICATLGTDACQVEIIDVRSAPKRAELARVLAIPTLIKTGPMPPLRVIGDLGDRQRILDALSMDP
jgi:circadian clock protein KaiB